MSSAGHDDGPPAFDEDEALSVIGKRVLVGVTRRNHADEIEGYEQFHGEIVRAGREGIYLRIEATGEERWLPPDLSSLHTAKPGEYRLKSTGEIVVDPDFLATWTLYPPVRH